MTSKKINNPIFKNRLTCPLFKPGKWLGYLSPIVFVPIVVLLFFDTPFFVKTFGVIIIILFLLFWVFLIILIRKHDTFFNFTNEKLIVNKNKEIKEFNLNEISHFLVITTICLQLVKKDLFIIDTDKNKIRIYNSDNANPLKRSWEKFHKKLEDITGKKVVLNQLVEDANGKIFSEKDYKKIPINERASFFKGYK